MRSKRGTRALMPNYNRNLLASKPQNSSQKFGILGPRNLIISRRSQITLWIIMAIVIVAGIFLLFYLTPLKTIFVPSTPTLKLEGCLGDKLEEAIELTSKRGGSIEPVNAFMYDGEKVEYLCYTNHYYKTCTMQQPLLKQHIEREILEYIEPQARKCIEDLKKDLRKKGYSVSQSKEYISVEILPDNIKAIVSGLSIVKGDIGESYEKFEVEKKSKIYSLIMLATSILNWEARYGDSDITAYMIYYPNVKVEKYKQQDGSKIYLLTDTITKDKFNFATRSISWPAGYGIGQTYTPV